MLNNGITSVTCIHREAGIKTRHKKGEKTEKMEEGKERRKDIDESEAIKNQSSAYLLEKRRPWGEEEEGDEEPGTGGEASIRYI